jgi:hypothetical protein
MLQDACVTLDLGCPIGDLGLQGLGADHRLFEIGAIDREGQVGLVRQKPPDVGERRIFELDNKFLVVVRRDQVRMYSGSSRPEAALSASTLPNSRPRVRPRI